MPSRDDLLWTAAPPAGLGVAGFFIPALMGGDLGDMGSGASIGTAAGFAIAFIAALLRSSKIDYPVTGTAVLFGICFGLLPWVFRADGSPSPETTNTTSTPKPERLPAAQVIGNDEVVEFPGRAPDQRFAYLVKGHLLREAVDVNDDRTIWALHRPSNEATGDRPEEPGACLVRPKGSS